MHLTDEKFHAIALNARNGFRECLKMIELHGGDSNRAFLNPPIVMTSVATWERFAVDLACANAFAGWQIEDAGWDREFDGTAPWPGSFADRRASKPARYDHVLDGLLGMPLTSGWKLYVAQGWKGADPNGWTWVDYSAAGAVSNRDVLRRAVLSAKSARDAAAHRLPYKKSKEAQLRKRDGRLRDDWEDREPDWCYMWQSDNTSKSGRTPTTPEGDDPGRPTIQHGYARGVVALFMQLVDVSIETVRAHHDWYEKDSHLPTEWFNSTIRSGPCSGMSLWGGQDLFRRG